jgi:hypothetical protein
MSMGAGVRVDAAVVGKTLPVSFRALDAEHLKARHHGRACHFEPQVETPCIIFLMEKH